MNHKLTTRQKKIRRRILEISWKKSLGHLGSCFSAVDLIDCIYRIKRKEDIFVLSCGHAGVALYAILEDRKILSPKQTEKLYLHPDLNPKVGIEISSGSLGQGLPIAVGMAMADRRKQVYCLISDGECAEGSIWEALQIASENNLGNLTILVNANGWGAYGRISLNNLFKRLKAWCDFNYMVDGHDADQIMKVLKTKRKVKPLLIFAKTRVNHLSFLRGLDAHYYIMSEKDYRHGQKLWQ